MTPSLGAAAAAAARVGKVRSPAFSGARATRRTTSSFAAGAAAHGASISSRNLAASKGGDGPGYSDFSLTAGSGSTLPDSFSLGRDGDFFGASFSGGFETAGSVAVVAPRLPRGQKTPARTTPARSRAPTATRTAASRRERAAAFFEPVPPEEDVPRLLDFFFSDGARAGAGVTPASRRPAPRGAAARISSKAVSSSCGSW